MKKKSVVVNEKYISLKKSSGLYFLILIPAIPYLTMVEGNKNEQSFDISLLMLFGCLYVFCFLMVTVICRRFACRTKSQALTISFFTIFSCYHLAKLPFNNLESYQGFIFTLCIQAILLALLYLGIMRMRKLITVVAIAFFIVPAVSLMVSGANVSWDLASRLSMLGFPVFEKTALHRGEPSSSYSKSTKPNVYIFLFDGYQRSDVLNSFYGFNNSNFLKDLKNLGFTTYPNSQSNFPTTVPSLNYVLSLISVTEDEEKIKSQLEKKYYQLRTKNETPEVFRFFEENDYTVWTQSYRKNVFKGCGINCLRRTPILLYEETQYLKMTPLFDALRLFSSEFFFHLVEYCENCQ